jgi:hypothetical protein
MPRRPTILTLWTLLVSLAALGCLIPEVDDGQDDEDANNWFPSFNNNTNNSPNNDPGRPTNPERDNPSSPNYRGNFEAIISGDLSMTLDADGLGEATYSRVPAMRGFHEAHCLISLIDREPDAQGRTGYLLLHFPDERCPGAGAYTVVNEGDSVEAGSAHILFKSMMLETETPNGASYSNLSNASGLLTITASRNGVLKGELYLKLSMRSVDDGPPAGTSVEVRAAFDAPRLEL